MYLFVSICIQIRFLLRVLTILATLNKEEFNKSKKCSQYLVLSEAERNELQVYPKEAFKQVHWSKMIDE